MTITTPPTRPTRHAGPPGGARPRSGPPSAAQSIDPFRVIRRYFWLLVLSLIIGGGLGFAAWFALDRVYPLYSNQVYFQLQPGLRESREVGVVEFAREDEVVRLAQTEINLMLSRDVLGDAVRSPEVSRTRWIGAYTNADGSINYDNAIDDLMEHVTANLIRNSNLFQLRWSSHHADDVPVVLNHIASVYLDKRKQLDDNVFNENRGIFDNQLTGTVREIETLTGEIETFILEHGITTLEDPRFHTTYEELNSMAGEIQSAQSRLSMLVTRQEQIGRKLEGTIRPGDDDREIARQDTTVMRLDDQIAQLRATLESMRERYLDPNHPQIQMTDSRLRSAEEERNERIEKLIRERMQAELKATSDEVQRLANLIQQKQEQYKEHDARLRQLAASYTSFKDLEDRRALLEEQRTADLSLLRELDMMRLRADASRVRIWRSAMIPRMKSFPDIKLMVPLGMALMLGLTLAGVFLRELTDQRVKSVRDLSIVHGARVLGVIPELDEDPTKIRNAELAVRDQPTSVVAESYRQACAPLLKALDLNQYQSLMVVGGLPGSGTTTAVTNIASTLAASGRRILVVDANFRRPRLARAFGVADVAGGAIGLGDILSHDAGQNGATLDDAIVDVGNGIALLSSGTETSRVFERLNTVRFDEVLAELRNRYDTVIIDAPPAVVAGEAMALANKVDASLLVVRANVEQRGLVARVINQLADTRSELIGVLLNGARMRSGGYFKKNFAAMASYSSAPKSKG